MEDAKYFSVLAHVTPREAAYSIRRESPQCIALICKYLSPDIIHALFEYFDDEKVDMILKRLASETVVRRSLVEKINTKIIERVADIRDPAEMER